MKDLTVPVSNVLRLVRSFEGLASAAYMLPKIALLYGRPGLGKSTAIAYLKDIHGGVFVRATAGWTPTAMLRCILRELDREDLGGNNQTKLEEIVRLLRAGDKPLYVDEADYVFERKGTVDYLRDIHDLAGVPLFLIGMENIKRKVNSRELVASRVASHIQFAPLSIEDATLVASQICEVTLADDLIADLHEKANGSIRRITIGLAQVEAYAQAQLWRQITLDQWTEGQRPYFLER